jgi:hypothetical protein
MFGNASPGISTRAITPQTIGLAGLAQHHQGIADAHVAMVDPAVGAQAASLLHRAEHLDQEVDEPLGAIHDDVGVHADVLGFEADVEHLTHWRRIALVTDIDFPAAELGCGS